jgi:VWFA-related protein
MLLLAIALAGAQQGIAQASSMQAPETESREPLETLQVNVNVVNVFCNVKDKRGALIPDLKKEDFELYEDKAKQNIKYFSSETNQPLTLGMLIDTSGSLQAVLPMEQEVGSAFLDEVVRDRDLGFLISFDTRAELLQDLTSASRELRHALRRTKVTTPPPTAAGPPGIGQGPFPTASNTPGTVLYDAVYLAATEKLSREVGRKALIILTDGVDEGSRVKLRDAIEATQKSDAICYVLLFTGGIYGGGGGGEMNKLAQETGGRVFEISKPDKLKPAFDQIANELRTQYNLGYTPTNNKKDGSFRRIEIRTKKEYKVQARRGYYALPEK